MVVKLTRADGATEIFQTEKYIIGKDEDIFDWVVKISIYENGKLIYKWTRKNYKAYIKKWKPKVQEIQP